MDWERIEQRLSEHLEGESYPVDTDALWGAVEPHIPKKKRKNRLWFFLIPGILFLVSGAFYLGFTMASEGEENRQNDIVENTIEAIALNKINNGKNVQSRANQISQNANLENANHTNNELKLNTSESEEQSLETTRRSSDQNAFADRASYNNSSNFDQVESEISALSYDARVINSVDEYSLITETNETLLPNNFKSSSTINSRNQGSILNRLTGSINPLQIGQISIPELPKNAWLKRVPFRKNNSINLYTEVSGGVSILSGGLTLNNLELAPGYANRQDAESKLLSLAGSLKLGIGFNRHWSIQTGLLWSQLYKRSQTSLQFTREVMLEDAVLQELYTTNGVQQIRGSVAVVESVSQQVNRINKYQQLLLPVSILYRNSLNGLFYDVELGGATSILNNYSGFIHPSSENEYSISEDPNNWLRNGSNQYIIGGIGLGYPISNKLEINGRMNYYHHINGLNSRNYGIGESLSFIQLQIGLRHHF